MPPVGDSISYQLELIHPTGCNPTVAKVLQYNSAKSNISNRINPTGIYNQLTVDNLQLTIFPNPYTGKTEISYDLKEKSAISLVVLNVLGEKVKTIVNKVQNAGKYQYRFGGSETGSSSGIFILKLIVNDKVYTKRLLELR